MKPTHNPIIIYALGKFEDKYVFNKINSCNKTYHIKIILIRLISSKIERFLLFFKEAV